VRSRAPTLWERSETPRTKSKGLTRKTATRRTWMKAGRTSLNATASGRSRTATLWKPVVSLHAGATGTLMQHQDDDAPPVPLRKCTSPTQQKQGNGNLLDHTYVNVLSQVRQADGPVYVNSPQGNGAPAVPPRKHRSLPVASQGTQLDHIYVNDPVSAHFSGGSSQEVASQDGPVYMNYPSNAKARSADIPPPSAVRASKFGRGSTQDVSSQDGPVYMNNPSDAKAPSADLPTVAPVRASKTGNGLRDVHASRNSERSAAREARRMCESDYRVPPRRQGEHVASDYRVDAVTDYRVASESSRGGAAADYRQMGTSPHRGSSYAVAKSFEPPSLHRQTYYLGKYTRAMAEKELLRDGRDGCFLVRNSSNATEPVLSFLHQGVARHTRVRQHASGMYFLGDADSLLFKTVEELIASHHCAGGTLQHVVNQS